MPEIVKTLLGVLLILVLVFAGTGIVSAGIDSTGAQRYVSDLTDELEASNFADEVIDDVLARVNEQTDVDENPQVKHYSNLTITRLATAGDPYADAYEVSMDYKFTIPFLNAGGTTHTVVAYAR